MKKIKWLLVLITSFITINAQTYQLIWSDEFDGSVLDPSIWTRETGGHGWGNNESQFYTNRDTNAYLENGTLVIQALKENYSGKNYTSARLKTQNKQSFLYGKLEARIKVPYGQGIWPAFWMLGDSFSSVGWPACGEIDIMELLGHQPNIVYGTAHWSNNGSHASYGGNFLSTGSPFSDDFHTYSIIWDQNKIEWFVDNMKYHTIDITPSELSEFHSNHFFILNIAVGGNWPGFPNETTVFPQKMIVDYVRVYKDASAVPDVAIINPINNAIVEPNSDIEIEALVTFDGEIEKVEFYQGSAKIGIAYAEPYTMNWENVSAGCYNISAKAISTDNYTGSSFNVKVKVGNDCVESPYLGTPFNIPGTIEAENFNQGINGEAYNDNTLVNEGGVYRKDDYVGIELCSDVGEGYNLGWIETGEWIDYTANVTKSGTYNFEARVASENANGKFKIQLDGTDLTSTINVPNTSGWQTWQTVTSSNVELNEGIHTFRVYIENGGFNLNRLDIYEPNTAASVNVIYPNGGEIIGVNSYLDIQWNSLKVQSVRIGISTDNGANWDFVTQSAEAQFGVYRWKVPNIESDQCLIMILDESDFNIRDTSNSTFTITSTVNVDDDIVAAKLNLEQNYPNPFNPSTIINYSLDSDQFVVLRIYDMLGNEIRTLVNQHKSAGNYNVEFNASNLPTGVYYYRISAGDFNSTKKMIYIK